MTRDFLYFADIAFSSFKQIEYWITFNEPITFCVVGYADGQHAPGRCLNPFKCRFAWVMFDLFKCGHTALVAHGHAVDLYRKKYGTGKISMANNGEWSEPITNDPKDVEAAQRKFDAYYGWFMDPLYTGEYPKSMLKTFGMAMPKFTEKERKLIKGSTDFVALNHYTTTYAGARSTKVNAPQANRGVPLAPWKAYFFDINARPIGLRAESVWLYVVPWGFQRVLEYIHKTYGAPDIYVTENGFSVYGEQQKSQADAMRDIDRVSYYKSYLEAMAKAQSNGVKIKGYMAWSLMDNFEWAKGYDDRFGSVYVDRDTQKRYLKDSAYFLRKFFNQTISK